MSYAAAAAAAAAAGTSSQKSSNNNNTRNQNGNRSERYFNEKMIICMVHGFNTDQLADALHKSTILHAVFGLQSVDFGRRYALVVEDKIVRETMVTQGLQSEGRHVLFYFHKKRPLRILECMYHSYQSESQFKKLEKYLNIMDILWI